MRYKIEIYASSIDDAVRRVRSVICHDVSSAWIIAPDGRAIACVEHVRPSWILPSATDDEQDAIVAGLPDAVVMGGQR